jgi:hypothetical protein
MNIEMTLTEAEILIAVLTGAEGSFAVTNPPLVEALKVLRPLRSAMMQKYLHERMALAGEPGGQKDTK